MLKMFLLSVFSFIRLSFPAQYEVTIIDYDYNNNAAAIVINDNVYEYYTTNNNCSIGDSVKVTFYNNMIIAAIDN